MREKLELENENELIKKYSQAVRTKPKNIRLKTQF